jgi:hypothetical protein
MPYTPEQIRELRDMGFTVAQIHAAEKRLEKTADETRALEALASVGITEATIAALIDAHEVALSSNEDSAWAGFVIGSLPFDTLGVSIKIVTTVTDPEAFPEIRDALVARKAKVAQAKKQGKAATRLASAPRLSA